MADLFLDLDFPSLALGEATTVIRGAVGVGTGVASMTEGDREARVAMRAVGEGRGEDCRDRKRESQFRPRLDVRSIDELTVGKSGFFGSPTERAATKDLGF